ncbi:MAG: membrane bound O-acyl transferase family-domain-containing protein [Planctomycetes bacterium]|nr:membrane bound O-acyl transferase family-domain-containing protein [Planctomycetota bacterium]
MNARARAAGRPAAGLPLRLAAWSAGPVLVALAHWLLLDAHPVARMGAIIGVLFFWMKAVVLAESAKRERAAGEPVQPASLRFALNTRLIAWLFLWPGMRPGKPALARENAMGGGAHATLVLRGLGSIACGVGLIALGVWICKENWWLRPGWWFWLAGVPSILAGISLVLHFGLFTLVRAGWRITGYDAGPLFRNPFASRSLGDFWTRRWNLAYVEMCQETVMRVTRRFERGAATLAVFLFSGLLHEAAISLPVNAGYGLPTLYFALNGAAMLADEAWFTEGSIPARLWAAFWVIAPLPLLFHPWFIRGIVLPMVGVNL